MDEISQNETPIFGSQNHAERFPEKLILSAGQAEKGNVNMSLINTELSQVKDLFDTLDVCYINYLPENKTQREILFHTISVWKNQNSSDIFTEAVTGSS